jgi:hypothetical protein
MSSPRALAPLLVLLLLTACGPDPTPEPVDSGVTTDAGPSTDAGQGTDAGPDMDAGADAGPDTPLNITTVALPDAYVGRAYSATLVAVGGVPPHTFSLTDGSLPAGLMLSAEGVLSGTPTSTAQASFSATARDSADVRVTAPFTLTPYALPALAELPSATLRVGDDVARSLTVTGGKAPFTFTSTPLPPGLTLTQGSLQGTLSQAGTFTFDVTATDANGMTATRSATFTVAARFAITSGVLPQGTLGQSYQFTLTAAGGRAPLSWSITSGALPGGLTLSSTGVLSGTPDAAGTSTVTVTVRDADGQMDSRELSLSVRDPGAPVFTVGHWNITYFGDDTRGPPNSGTHDSLQLAHTRHVMRDAGANLWGMVEMVDPGDFDTLKAQLPGFSGFLSNNTAFVTGSTSPYGTNSQKLGVLYDHTLTFQSARLILNDATNLPDFSNRPPLRVDFTTEIQDVETPLTVIVVHMRAESADPTGPRDARQRASAALKKYIDDNLPTQHVLVVGDWNDDVDVSITLDPNSGTPLPTPYQDFVSDSEGYTFITRALSLAGDDTSIGFENVVDHTLASNELAARYVASSARVIYADTWVPDFLNTVSDHRPVTSTYSLSAQTGPFLRLKAPQGGTYQAGSVLAVTWTHWGLGSVRVEASTNGGAQWDVLAASVPAEQGSYLWTLPNIESSSVLVRVVDTTNPGRMDTSDAPLTLTPASGRAFINEVLANEPNVGGQNNPAYEFVEIVNTGPTPVDLSGWTLWDHPTSEDAAANRRHVFASGTTLAAGKSLVVVGGTAGLPAGRTNAVVASNRALGLGNDSDTVRLRKPDGSIADRLDYSSTEDNVSWNRSPDGNPTGTFVLHNTLSSTRTISPGVRADGSEF